MRGASYLSEDLVFGVDEAATFLELIGLLLSFLLHFKSSIIIPAQCNIGSANSEEVKRIIVGSYDYICVFEVIPNNLCLLISFLKVVL